MASGSNKTRIDMGHGFMKQIIQNQVDRDNYDKEVKAKQTEKPRSRNVKSKKPDMGVYVPPTKLKELFVLEFEDHDGSVFSTPVYKYDRADVIAQKVGQEKNLSAEFVSALEERLECEISMRENQQKDPDS